MQAEEDLLLSVRQLKTSIFSEDGPVQAVRGIDLSLKRGERLGIVGESGCGKSVSMLSVMRLLSENAKVSAEEIRFDGEELSRRSDREMRKLQGKELSMIFQDPMTSLNPLFSIGEQLTAPIRRHLGLSGKEAEARALRVLEQVGIPDPAKRMRQYPHELSGGMRQRVMIAIAISCDPKLLIADEPTTALDVTIQAQILELLERMTGERGMAMILITHDLGVIAGMCTRVLVMYGGLVMEEGTVRDIFYRTAHPYTKGLLDSIPNSERKKLIPIFGTPPDLLNPPEGCPFAARCPHAMKLCRAAKPALTEVSEGHRSACWLLHPAVKKKKGEEIPA